MSESPANENPIKEVIGDLFRYLELLETQTAAILRVLKDKGISTEEDFASYSEEASNAANVKWRAARARMEKLFAAIPEEKPGSPTSNKESAASANESDATANKEPDRKKEAIEQPQSPQPESAGKANGPGEKPVSESLTQGNANLSSSGDGNRTSGQITEDKEQCTEAPAKDAA